MGTSTDGRLTPLHRRRELFPKNLTVTSGAVVRCGASDIPDAALIVQELRAQTANRASANPVIVDIRSARVRDEFRALICFPAGADARRGSR